MKVIELLNKIANGEEVPKKLNIDDWEYDEEYDDLEYEIFQRLYNEDFKLNDEVEIIEEPKDHKIPEKIFLNQTYGTCYIDLYSYKQVPLKREKLSPEEVSIINKINEILDYLEKRE